MQRPTHLELITLGDELLLGIRPNGHLNYLGTQLTRHGILVARNHCIRDEAEEITDAFRNAWARSDIVVTTGGLGPTQDDLTRETIAEFLDRPLEHVPEVEAEIRERFDRLGRTVTDNNLRQAKKPRGAEILPNRFGTAPGLWIEEAGKICIMLPGPPNELQPMFEDQVLPRLYEMGIAQRADAYLQLRTTDIGESGLANALEPVALRHEGRLALAYCAHEGIVDVRLSAVDGRLNADELERIGDECREVIGEDFVCFGDADLSELVIQQLRNLDKRLAVAESCTGGLLASRFTDIPGASKVFAGGIVCYNNDAKVQLLDVPEAIIQQHGAVSAECAVAMATGAAERFSAEYALSVTGFAGPGGGTLENPVGTIYLGYSSPIGAWSQKIVAPGSRLAVKVRAVNTALDWMHRKLRKYQVEELLLSLAV